MANSEKCLSVNEWRHTVAINCLRRYGPWPGVLLYTENSFFRLRSGLNIFCSQVVSIFESSGLYWPPCELFPQPPIPSSSSSSAVFASVKAKDAHSACACLGWKGWNSDRLPVNQVPNLRLWSIQSLDECQPENCSASYFRQTEILCSMSHWSVTHYCQV